MQEKSKQTKVSVGVSGNAYYGLHAAPPHQDHARILRALCDDGRFTLVTAVVAGTRTDKPEYCAPVHRREMMRLVADELRDQCGKHLVVDDEGIERPNTPTYTYIQAKEDENPSVPAWFVVGADCVVPHEAWGGACVMQQEWYRGKELFEHKNFLVIPREGYPQPHTFALPNNFSILEVSLSGISSEAIRERVRAGNTIEGWVAPAVARYIAVHALFQG